MQLAHCLDSGFLVPQQIFPAVSKGPLQLLIKLNIRMLQEFDIDFTFI